MSDLDDLLVAIAAVLSLTVAAAAISKMTDRVTYRVGICTPPDPRDMTDLRNYPVRPNFEFRPIPPTHTD